MLALAIESSCDDTSLALLEFDHKDDLSTLGQGITILKSITSSSIEIQKKWGGVVPELSARSHAEVIHKLFELEEFGNYMDQLDYIFVTSHPGLASGLKVGVSFAESLYYFLSKNKIDLKLHKFNHLHGHIASAFFQEKCNLKSQDLFPHLHLLVSGGNTQLIFMNGWNDWEIVGDKMDDAAGEALDKTGRMIGIRYPAGKTISEIAGEDQTNYLDLPVGLSGDKSYNFSFSGIKTAVRYKIRDAAIAGVEYEEYKSEEEILDMIHKDNVDLPPNLAYFKKLAISIQSVILKQLTNKLELAIKSTKPSTIGLSGGVANNQTLREYFEKNKLPSLIAKRDLTTDNAVMIGLAGIFGVIDKSYENPNY